MNMDEHAKQVIDAVSVTGLIATMLEMLPDATAILTFIWILLRIYETKTVQKWLGK